MTLGAVQNVMPEQAGIHVFHAVISMVLDSEPPPAMTGEVAGEVWPRISNQKGRAMQLARPLNFPERYRFAWKSW